MAPIDPDFHNSHFLGITTISTYVIAVAGSISLIAHTLYRAYGNLPIAKRTRSRAPERRHDVLISLGLAGLSFALNAYHVVEAAIGSYSNWTLLNENALPINIWTASAWFPSLEKPSELQIGRWLGNVDWLQEVAFALGGRSRDYWWAQQLSAATMVFSIFVAIEGRRRNIPYTWAFIFLAHLVGLSTAQNLFNVALLVTPIPIVRRRRSSTAATQSTWTPHPALHITPFFLTLLCTAIFPYMSDNRALFVTSAIPAMMTFVPLFVAKSNLIPTSWGKTHTSIHAAHASSLPVFANTSRLAFALHLITTVSSIFLNIPSRQTSQNFIWTTYHSAPLTFTSRLRILLSRLLGSLSDNPLVRKVGWDVLLSGTSLIIWAFVRGLDASQMLSSAGVPGVQAAKSAAIAATEAATEFATSTAKSAAEKATAIAESTKTVTKEFVESTRHIAKDIADAALHTVGLEQDEGAEEDAEAKSTGAEVPSPSKRKAGRPRKTAAISSRTTRATTAQADDDENNDDDDVDADYAPTRRAKNEEVEHEEEHAPLALGDETEGAALAWGLLVLGGLGMASAGVFGGEVLGR